MPWLEKLTNSLPFPIAKLVMPSADIIGKAPVSYLNKTFNKNNGEVAVVSEVNKRLFAGALSKEDAAALDRSLMNRCLHDASSWVQNYILSKANLMSCKMEYTAAHVGKIWALSIFWQRKYSQNFLICQDLLKDIAEDESKCFQLSDIRSAAITELLQYDNVSDALMLASKKLPDDVSRYASDLEIVRHLLAEKDAHIAIPKALDIAEKELAEAKKLDMNTGKRYAATGNIYQALIEIVTAFGRLGQFEKAKEVLNKIDDTTSHGTAENALENFFGKRRGY
jgi:hypothetical protein